MHYISSVVKPLHNFMWGTDEYLSQVHVNTSFRCSCPSSSIQLSNCVPHSITRDKTTKLSLLSLYWILSYYIFAQWKIINRDGSIPLFQNQYRSRICRYRYRSDTSTVFFNQCRIYISQCVLTFRFRFVADACSEMNLRQANYSSSIFYLKFRFYTH